MKRRRSALHPVPGYPLLQCLMSECLPAPGTGIFVPRLHQWWCGSRGKLHPLSSCLEASPHPNLPFGKPKASPPPLKSFFELHKHRESRQLAATTRAAESDPAWPTWQTAAVSMITVKPNRHSWAKSAISPNGPTVTSVSWLFSATIGRMFVASLG